MSAGGELAAIERIRARLGEAPAGQVWAGDDAAVVAGPAQGERLLLAADAVVAGVHADLALVGLDDLGWKALVANLSDVAAMGGRPGHAVVTVAGPASTDLDQLYQGLVEAASTWACPIVGGDLVNSATLVVTVAVTGTVAGPPVLRSGAAPGHAVMVTGALGGSAAGLAVLRSGRAEAGALEQALSERHRRPRPRVAEGLVAAGAGATAMIDVSDGLATDLRHLAQSSGVGVALELVPVAEGATEAEALGGGEDYELVLTCPDPEAMAAAFTAAGLAAPIRMGTCTAGDSQLTLRGRPLPPVGWQHGWESA